ncbi:DUF2070 family protein [Infirmifilum sp. SLHALR2]|nr:MAG: hypothetical protein B7L53_04960 [Thermofilum sp. NZ13]
MTDSKFEGFRKGYKWLFRLPGTSLVLSATAGIFMLELLLAPAVGYDVRLFLTSAFTTGLPYLVSVLADRSVLTPRRALGFFLVYLLLLLPLILLKKPPVAASTVTVLLSFLVFIAVARRRALILYLSVYLALTYLFAPTYAYASLTVLVLYALLALPVLLTIDKRVRQVAGVGGLKYLRGFLRYTLSGEKDEVEECIKASSTRKTVPIHVFIFRSGSEVIGRLVVSGVHPGPLRTLGSSTLPEKVVTKCPPTLFLKAPAGHGENLAVSSEVDRVAEEVCGALSLKELPSTVRLGLAQGKLVSSLAIRLPGVSLCLLDPQVPMEDLPPSLREEFERKGVVLADLHNMISEDYLQLPESPDSAPELYLEVLRTIQESLEASVAEGQLKAGFAWIGFSDGVSIGKAGIACLAVEVGGKIVGVISFDGNNMTPKLKARLLQEVGKRVDYLLVGTTDTHVLTGVFQGVDYYPVGTFNEEALLEKSVKCLEEAKNNMRECSVLYGVYPVSSFFMDNTKLKGLSAATRLNVRDGLVLAVIALALYPLLLFLT